MTHKNPIKRDLLEFEKKPWDEKTWEDKITFRSNEHEHNIDDLYDQVHAIQEANKQNVQFYMDILARMMKLEEENKRLSAIEKKYDFLKELIENKG